MPDGMASGEAARPMTTEEAVKLVGLTAAMLRTHGENLRTGRRFPSHLTPDLEKVADGLMRAYATLAASRPAAETAVEPSDLAIAAACGWLPGDDPPTEHEWWQVKKALAAAYAVDFGLRSPAGGATAGETDLTGTWTVTELVAQFCKDEMREDYQPTSDDIEMLERFGHWLHKHNVEAVEAPAGGESREPPCPDCGEREKHAHCAECGATDHAASRCDMGG